MRDHSAKHGAFSWNELITTDLESARNFYGTLFGWTFTETTSIHGHTYLTVFKDKAMVGGMMLKDGNVSEDVPLCWDTYVAVDDVESSARQTEEYGGTILLPPTDIPGVARFCVMRDPQGAVLNLITYLP